MQTTVPPTLDGYDGRSPYRDDHFLVIAVITARLVAFSKTSLLDVAVVAVPGGSTRDGTALDESGQLSFPKTLAYFSRARQLLTRNSIIGFRKSASDRGSAGLDERCGVGGGEVVVVRLKF